MKAKDIVIVALLLIVAGLCYPLGYRTGIGQVSHKNELWFHISVHTKLYHSAEAGDLKKVQQDLAGLLFGEVLTYEELFGPITGTNSSAKHFADAKVIADRFATQLVPLSSILSNDPGAKVKSSPGK